MRCLLALWICALSAPSWATEPDIAWHNQARKMAVSKQCSTLRAQAMPESPIDRYGKAICLLFGLAGPAQPDVALDLLRGAAEQGDTEAQLALADTLQAGDPGAQALALHWYQRAAAAGDLRARLRHDRLAPRAQAAQVRPTHEPLLPMQPATTAQNNPLGAVGPGDESMVLDASADLSELPPGYHCHPFAFGKKICHTGPQ